MRSLMSVVLIVCINPTVEELVDRFDLSSINPHDLALLVDHDQGQTRVSKTIPCQDRDLGHFLLDFPVFHTLAMHLFWLPLLI